MQANSLFITNSVSMNTYDTKYKSGRGIAPRVNHNEPKLIRLPKQGVPCEWTGLSRAKMAQLVVPSKENEFSPPVRSVSLGPDKDSKGWTRLVYFDSLMAYLDSKIEGGK